MPQEMQVRVLRRLGSRTVVLFGITTDQCVSTTARVGANTGYRVILVEDACDCFALPGPDGRLISARDIHLAHVATLGAEFATVVTTAEAVAAASA